MPNGWSGASSVPAWTRAVDVLQDAGAEVVEVMLTSSRVDSRLDVRPVYCAGLKSGVNAWLRAVGADGDAASLEAILAFNEADMARRAPRGHDLLVASQTSPLTDAEYAAQGLRNRHISAQAVRNALVDYSVDALVGVGSGLVFTAAVAGLPSLSVPAGYRDTGEPVGMLLVGEYGRDGELLTMAYAFEHAGRLRVDPKIG